MNHELLTMNLQLTPKELGYYFPAEFAPHVATWLSWPHKEASWPGKINTIFPYYAQFIKTLSLSEQVRINVADEAMKNFALGHLQTAEVDLNKVEFFFHPTNDAWCRDHGPAFLINPNAEQKKVIVDWVNNNGNFIKLINLNNRTTKCTEYAGIVTRSNSSTDSISLLLLMLIRFLCRHGMKERWIYKSISKSCSWMGILQARSLSKIHWPKEYIWRNTSL